ncbi:MAG: endolytic transglycosylase MltG [Treponema sp.]
MKKTLLILVTVSLFFTAVFAGVCVYCFMPVSSHDSDVPDTLFIIKKGASLRRIAMQLKEEQLVRSEYAAYLYFRWANSRIQAGAYKLSKTMPLHQLCNYLESGKQEYIKVTIPEGITASKIALLLEQNGIISADSFLQAVSDKTLLNSYAIPGETAEGFLFPDTYFFNYNETGNSVVKILIDNFFSKTASIPQFPHDAGKQYETVILASIIEREYRIPEEAVKIAGVFTNRLAIGMGLQSCATIEYIITEIQHKPHPQRLFTKDLEINNPYNTYKWRGLPPGPIANPGMTSLYAACNPEKNGYYFFRLEDPVRGNHIFTKNLSDHTRAGALIIKKAAGQ